MKSFPGTKQWSHIQTCDFLDFLIFPLFLNGFPFFFLKRHTEKNPSANTDDLDRAHLLMKRHRRNAHGLKHPGSALVVCFKISWQSKGIPPMPPSSALLRDY